MAGTNLDASISLGGEKEFRQAIRDINSNLKILDSELKLAAKEFENNAKSQEALTKKQELLNRKIDEEKKKIELLNKQLEASNQKRQKAAENINKYKQQLQNAERAENQDVNEIKRLQEQLEKEQRTYDRATQSISKYQIQINNASGDLIDYQNQLENTNTELERQSSRVMQAAEGFQAAGEKLKTIGNNISSFGKSFSIGVSAPATAALGASVKTGMSYEKSLSQVQATMGLEKTSEEMQKLKATASAMGEQTQFSASQAAEALNYLALAGYDADESISTLPSVFNAALAGSMDLATASDMITDAMSALGLSVDDADDFIDKMAVTSSKANTNIAQLGEGILTVGGTAKNLKGGVVELDTALGILADNGIKGAEGGTQLRNAILALTAGTDKAKEQIEALGLEVFDSSGNLRGLNEIFTDLDATLSTMSQEERLNVLNEIFNKNDIKGIEALLANATGRFDELSSAIANSDGAAQKMADTMADNFSGSVAELKSKLEALQNEAFEAMLPTLNSLVEKSKNFIDWLKGLDAETQKSIVSMTMFAAAIGPVLIVIGKLISAIGSISVAIGKVASGVKTAISTLNGLSAGLGTTLGIAGAAGVAIYALASAIIAVGNAAVDARLEALKGSEAMQEFTNEYDEMETRLKDNKDAVDELTTSNQKNLDMIDVYIKRLPETCKRLDELTSKTDKTAEEQAELERLIKEINNEFPEMNLALDANTGQLNLNTEAIIKNANAYKFLAESKGAYAVAEKEGEAKAEAEIDLRKAQKDKEEAQREYNIQKARYDRTSNVNSKYYNEEAAKDAKIRYEEAAKKVQRAGSTAKALERQIAESDKRIEAAYEQAQKANAEYEKTINEESTSASNAGNKASKWYEERDRSQQWINRRKELKDWEAFNTTEADSYKRMLNSLSEYYKQGDLDYKEYIAERDKLNQKYKNAQEETNKNVEESAEQAQKAAAKAAETRQKQVEKDAENAKKQAEKQAEEELKARREAYKKEQERSKKWIEYRNLYGDYDQYETTEGDSYGRLIERAGEAYKDGILEYKDYVSEISSLTADMADKEIDFYETVFAYLAEQYQNGLLDYQDYLDQRNALEALAYKEQQKDTEERNKETYQKQQERSKKWIEYRNLYGDYDQYETTEGDSYGRLIERAGKAYQDGVLEYKDYVSEISSLTADMADKEIDFYETVFAYLKDQYANGLLEYEDYLDQYNDLSALAFKSQQKKAEEIKQQQKTAVEKMYDAEIARQKAQIDQIQAAINKENARLRSSWEREDRQRDLAELYEEADKYRKSVTITGQEHYKDIEKQIESLEREEEMAQLEEKQAAIMEQLQKEYDAVEAKKNALLEAIEESQKAYQIDMNAGIDNMSSILESIRDALANIVPKNNVTYNYTDNSVNDNQNHSTYNYNNKISDNTDLELLNRIINKDKVSV